jgi:hypothetical protein
MFEMFRLHPISENTSWRRILSTGVGGVTDIGFSSDEAWLLIVSHDGRGLFDLATGKRAARDDEQPSMDSPWIDPTEKLVTGIGPAARVNFAVAGLSGGTLAMETPQGWRAELTRWWWRPDIAILHGNGKRWLVAKSATEIRAFGFSSRGSYLALGTSSDVYVFRHEDSHHG